MAPVHRLPLWWPPALNWPTWAAGCLVLGALVHFQLAIAAYPVYFSELHASSSVRYSWTLGWPLPFATWTSTQGWGRFTPLSLFVDLTFAAALVSGTMAAVQRWAANWAARPPVHGQALAVMAISALGWLLLLQTLSIPGFVLLGWAALVVIFLAVPCAVYTLVIWLPTMRHSTRYSMRTLFVVITLACIVAALVAWNRT